MRANIQNSHAVDGLPERLFRGLVETISTASAEGALLRPAWEVRQPTTNAGMCGGVVSIHARRQPTINDSRFRTLKYWNRVGAMGGGCSCQRGK
jgi:hypothetical protein